MSERRVNVRLQAIGADGVKRELADVGASGKASLSQIGDGAKEAGEGMQRAGDGASRFERAMRNGTTRNIAQQLNQVAQSGLASGNWLQALAIGVHHGDVVGFARQVLSQRAADLPRAEDDDLHPLFLPSY